MLKKRNAMELSINTIILAVIGLIILVVIIAIITKESGRAANVFGKCEGRAGKCVDAASCIDGVNIPDICQDENEVCCVKIEK